MGKHQGESLKYNFNVVLTLCTACVDTECSSVKVIIKKIVLPLKRALRQLKKTERHKALQVWGNG